MFRTTLRAAAATAAAACVVAATLTGPMGGTAHAEDLPRTEILPDFGTVVPMKDAAVIRVNKWGYRYKAGQQDSRLTITFVDGKLRYADTGTKELRRIPDTCVRKKVSKGIAAVCTIPRRFSEGRMFLEVWPRLGDDHVDGSSLPAKFRMWVLADAGLDVVRTGAGDDFVNGAQDRDRVWGGAGDDWLRTGIGNDTVYGQNGDDRIVSQDGADTVDTGAGTDRAECGTGRDSAIIDGADFRKDCESVTRR
jgi:serralysin